MSKVIFTSEAENDIFAIYRYILVHDGKEQAKDVMLRLEKTIMSLNTLPRRGKCPPEMLALGVMDFYEIQCAPWRIFYQITADTVWVMAVLDSRRALDELLLERLAQ